MIVYLFNDHTGAVEDDRVNRVKTCPAYTGTLYAGGRAVETGNNSVEDAFSGMECRYLNASFVTDGGILFNLGRLRINANGIPVTVVEPTREVFRMRVLMDAMSDKVEMLEEKVQKLNGIYEKDALWMLKSKEV